MMRLSKTALLILGIGIFVIAMGSLFMVYRGQVSEQEILNNKLTTAQNALPPLISEKEKLASQLTALEDAVTEAELSLSKAKVVFPDSAESIEYDEELFMIAHDYGLEIVELKASEPQDQEGDDEIIIYIVTTFEVMVSPAAIPPEAEDAYEAYCDNAVASFLDFINTVVNGEYFTTATVEEVVWEIPEITETARPVATFKLLIYSYYDEYEGE